MIVTCRSFETVCYYVKGTGLRGERSVTATSLCGLVSKSVNFTWSSKKKKIGMGFPDGSVVKNPHANAGDMGSIPDLERSHMPWSN